MRTLRQVFIIAVFALCLVAGLGYDFEPARNIVHFYVCACFFVAFFVNTEASKARREELGHPALPINVGGFLDLCATLFMVWHGAFLLAVLWCFSSLVTIGAWQKTLEQNKAVA
mgnify:CR=1 FL=1